MDAELAFEFFTSSSGGLLLVIDGPKPTMYRVIENKVDPKYGNGRGFLLMKVWGGTDAEATGYDVFVSGLGTFGQHDSCNCKSWLTRSKCKHHTAMKARVHRG